MKIKALTLILFILLTNLSAKESLKIAYLVDDMNIAFWKIISEGIKSEAKKNNYQVDIYTSNHNVKDELKNLSKIINSNYVGIITSPTNSSNAVTILRLAKTKNIPVVIADIGTEGGEYLSYISSNNYEGAYDIGKTFLKANPVKGELGIMAIPQTRENGKQRTKGFLDSIENSNLKTVGIKQFKDWDDKESYAYTKEFIEQYPNIKVLWIQTSNMYKGVLKALKDLKKENDILLLAYDAEPEFLKLIKEKKILISGMQQPYKIGQIAMKTLNNHLNGKEVEKNIQVKILIVSSSNIDAKLSEIKMNVFGINDAK